MVIHQYDVYWTALDPTIGSEINKTRPSIILSPDEMNDTLRTIIIAPITTKAHAFPTRIPIKIANKKGWVVLDQIRTIDRQRLVQRIGKATPSVIQNIKSTIQQMLVE